MSFIAHAPPVLGSASIWVLGQVAGPSRTATVIHRDDYCLQVRLFGQSLGVLGAKSVKVPWGIRTNLVDIPDVAVGTDVEIADGTIYLDEVEVLVNNIVDTTVPVLSPSQSAWGAEQLASLIDPHRQNVLKHLDDSALQGLAAGDIAAAASLLGQGPGLTPIGDDVLSGWLTAAVACRHPRLADMRSTVALEAATRTTVIATTLLNCSARGENVPEFRSLICGIATERTETLVKSIDLVSALNRADRASGSGLLLGAQIALSSLR